MNFEDYLLGNWTNKAQAQSDPQGFASVNIVWRKIEGGYESMNYKRVRGENDPYRKKYHKLEIVSDTQVIMHNYHSCLLYTSPSPRDATLSRMPSSA